jgi:thiol:disulfide interchange protein
MNPAARLLRTLLALAFAGLSSLAQALTLEPYSAQALAAAQAAGRPVAVHFHADWCSTCKQQEKVFAQLKTESGLDMVLLVADYDRERDLRRNLNVRSQSTLVVFRGSTEKARVGGETDPGKLRAALRSAL